MKERNFKKLGFFSALSICLGSIVGIGIFFKNYSISNAVQGDGTSWLLSWIISGIIALLVAVHFGKIAMVKNNGSTGLSSWVQRIATNKQNWFRHLVTVNYSFFYNAILVVIFGIFTTEIFFSFLKTINSDINFPPMWAMVLIAIFLIVFYSVLNKISIKTSGYISFATTILKFIPLLIAIFVGISLPNVHNAGGENAFDTTDVSTFESFKGIMQALPAALFAFDAFVGVGSMSRKIKGGEKVVSKVFVISMILVVISYLLISLSAILHYNQNSIGDYGVLPGSIESILKDVFSPDFARGMSIFVTFFLFVSASGTMNAIIGSTLSEFENISTSEKIFFTRQLNAKFGARITSLIYYSSAILFWSLVAYIPAMIMNSDAFVDGLSNFPTFFFFFIYSILIFLYWKNIFTKNKSMHGKRPWIYTSLVFISVISVSFAMILSTIFVFVGAINDPFDNYSWGFLYDNVKITNLVVAILYIVFAIIFTILPIINYTLFKMNNENNIFEDIDIEIANHQLMDNKNIVADTHVIQV
ncbi:MAG: APC family permease [Metamycoplasmataceae bacterium]